MGAFTIIPTKQVKSESKSWKLWIMTLCYQRRPHHHIRPQPVFPAHSPISALRSPVYSSFWCMCHLVMNMADDKGPICGSSCILVLMPQLPILLMGLWDMENHIPQEFLPIEVIPGCWHKCLKLWSLRTLHGLYGMVENGGRGERDYRAQGLTLLNSWFLKSGWGLVKQNSV